MKKNLKNKKNININQKSFYFEDYIETNQRQKKIIKSIISEDRIYLLFLFFFCLITVFALKISLTSIQDPKFFSNKEENIKFTSLRRDIVDRNGDLISRNIVAYHAALKPNLIKDKKKFLINIKLIFPNIDIKNIQTRLKKNKYFYLKKGLTEFEKKKLQSLGEKGIKFEPYQSRVYPHANLYSHIIGQIDYDNYGISGAEGFFDKELKNQNKINLPLMLSVDTNLQFLIKEQLRQAMYDFKAKGAAGLLMNANNGEVLSLVSLPDYNINLRNNISDKKYLNQITKGVFELGSVFKTFTVALALEENIVTPETIINNVEKKIKCSIHTISDIHVFPKNLSVENILIRSSNVGSLLIARKIGKERYINFLNKLNLFNVTNFELDEVGVPHNVRWQDKCKLETAAYGHGVTTTPIQAAAAYASITNGGISISPTLRKNKSFLKKRVIKKETSSAINKILRKVVTDKEGTASFANIFGYQVAGKTGTSKKYGSGNKNINTFISVFPASSPKYVLLVMLDEPKIATHLTYNYRGVKIKGTRDEAGWNSVYVAGKIIEQIGPILAINNKEFYNNHVVKKLN